MNDYVIFTDSACDIKPELLTEWGVRSLPLTFRFDGEETEYTNDAMPVKNFYDCMRAGRVAKTAAINADTFGKAFEAALQEGLDVLYLGFSSGLSTTFQSAQMAVEELQEAYPDRTVLAVDSRSASAGQGLLLYLTVQQQKQGASIAEAAAFVAETLPHLCHWFTVDDLVYLKRGGRISPAVAFVGGVLGIKPVLHMDDEGHLINVSKVRGRKKAVAALAEQFGGLATDKTGGTVFISHGDCEEDVVELATILKEQYGASVDVVTDVGPVIGAHTGPGVLALFFVGKNR